ncbi:MAG: FG-GAP-like repeat-containing protein [Chitinophagaceae bacterium]
MKKVILSLVFLFIGLTLTLAQVPVLGGYSATTIATAGGNSAVTPSTAPTNTTSISATTSTGFKGLLNVDPTTGVVRITDAQPSGSYLVTVKAFNFTSTATTNFTLVVGKTSCAQGVFNAAQSIPTGNSPSSIAIGDFNGDLRQDIVVANFTENSVTVKLGDGSGSFTGTGTITVGTGPNSIAVGDFNGDGKQDFVTANKSSTTLSVRLGDGNGNFTAAPDVAVGYNPHSVAIGDFNGDGIQDFAVANWGDSRVSIRVGDGSGNFTSLGNILVAGNPTFVVVGDFNGDGNQDFASAAYSSNTVSVRLGNGLGTFSSIADIPVGVTPRCLATGDFNKDGRQDLLVGNYNSNTISYLAGNGAGGFVKTLDVAVGAGPYSIATGDFNGDGNLDFASVNFSSGNVTVKAGNGAGSFASLPTITVGIQPQTVIVGDFDADGRQDIAVANSGSNSFTAHLANPVWKEIDISGFYTSITDGDTSPSILDGTDFGTVSASLSRSFVIHNTGGINLTISSILIKAGDSSMFTVSGLTLPATIAGGDSASFSISFSPTSAGLKSSTVVVSNDDCDEGLYYFAIQATGLAVLPVLGTYPATVKGVGSNTIITPSTPPVDAVSIKVSISSGFKGILLLNNVTGAISVTNAQPAGAYSVTVKAFNRFSSTTTNFTLTVNNSLCSGAFAGVPAVKLTTIASPVATAMGDFNGDGNQDLLVGGLGTNGVSLKLGDGMGGFSGASIIIPVGNSPYGIAVCDFNGDGNLDFAAANYNSNTVSIRFGNGAGAFTANQEVVVGTKPNSVAIGDFNGDGIQDLVVTNLNSSSASICMGTASGTFGTASSMLMGPDPKSVAVADFNGDGLADFAVVNRYYNNIVVRLGNVAGGFTNAADAYVGQEPFFVISGDFNNDGKADLAAANYASNNVSVRFGDGSGGFSGTSNFTVGANPWALTAGDFNGDGWQDLVTANYNDTTVSILLNNGSGGFISVPGTVGGSQCRSVLLGDFNSDGRQDIVTTNENTATITVRLANPAAPEIDVFGNGVMIPDGNSSPTVTDSTDFGPVSSTTMHRYIVRNSGNATLVVQSVVMRGGDSTAFRIGGINLPAIIAAGDSVSYTISFQPASTGTKQSTVVITSDDCDERIYDFVIRASPVPLQPTIGSYPASSIAFTAGNTVISPSTAPVNAVWITASTSAGFKGTLKVNPTTGVVAITNAYPAGLYTVIVKAGNLSYSATATFTLTVNNGLCGGNFSDVPVIKINSGTGPVASAIGDFNGDGNQDLLTANATGNVVSVLLGNGTGGFTASPAIAVGTSPYSIAVGDFNGDGDQDFVTANYNSNNVSVRLGNGSGNFIAVADVTAGSKPYSISIGDFNNDGIQDLAVANAVGGNVSIAMGDGSGLFSAPVFFAVGVNPESVTINDFNGDGNQDFAVVNYTGNTIAVRLGNGVGGFTSASNVSVGAGPFFVTSGDFNNDGKADLATVNYTNNSASIRFGTGTGGFTGTTNIAVGTNPYSLAIGDFNGDGNLDLLTSNYNDSTVSVRIGDGLGGFINAPNIIAGTKSRSVVVGDFNNDGRQDFVATNETANTLTVRLANPVIPEIAILGNNNIINDGDNTPSLSDNTDFGNAGATNLNRVFVIRNTGAGKLTVSTILARGGDSSMFRISGINFPVVIAAGDSTHFTLGFLPVSTGNKSTSIVISNDDCDESTYNFTASATAVATAPVLGSYTTNGAIDIGSNIVVIPTANPVNAGSVTVFSTTGFKGLVLINPITGKVTITNAHPAGVHTITIKAFNFFSTVTTSFTITVKNGLCNGGFSNTPPFQLSTANSPKAMAIGDFDGDGNQDVVVANSGSNSVTLITGNGSGAFVTSSNTNVGNTPYSVAAGDFNNDGYLDFVTPNYAANSISIRLGDGQGHFSVVPDLAVGTNPYSVAVGDFNGDGNPDLVVANSGNGTASLCLGSGSGVFTVFRTITLDNTPTGVVAGDFNGDGKLDFATCNYQIDNVSVRLGNGAGDFAAMPNVGVGTRPLSLTIGDFNNDGKQDLVVVHSTHTSASILIGDGAGNFTNTSSIPVGAGPYMVAVFDYNGDGNQDIATVNYLDTTVAICLGNGAGSFSRLANVNVGSQPRSIVVGDFNGDGRQDIAVVSQNGNKMIVRLADPMHSEIDVTGAGQSITDGSGSAVVTNNTDFGDVGATLAHDFYIHNYGTSNLYIGKVKAGGSDSLQFTMTGITYPLIIAPGDSAVFTIRFKPTGPGIKNAIIFIESDDCDETFYDFAIKGNGVAIVPVLSAYTDFTIASAGRNVVITPSGSPLNIASLVAITPTNFMGSMQVNSLTGAITITNARPAGVYNITVKAFNGFSSATRNFVLTVNDNNCSQGAFTGVSPFAAGAIPAFVTIGDFNGDGKQDLASANYNANNVSVYLGDGVGGFTRLGDVLVGTNPSSVATADFNGDGRLDIITANYGSHNLSVRFGNGDGNFSQAPDVPVGGFPNSVATGDFDGDGRLDLAVANYGGNNVIVCMGNGAGEFIVTASIVTGTNPSCVVTGDFNGDGKQDLAASNILDNNIAIILGNGSGGFATPTYVGVGTSPLFLTVGDFNNDGKLDIASANYGSNNVSVRTGNGSGGFPGLTTIPVGVQPFSLVVGDFNGDHNPDFVVANYGDSTASVRIGNGAGSFSSITNIVVGAQTRSVTAGDFNGDGRLDLALANEMNNSIKVALSKQTFPEIDILGNGISIAAGDTIPSGADFTDFGPVATSLTRNFSIHNTGTDSLIVSSILLATIGTQMFSTAGITLPVKIPPGSVSGFTITFAPSSPGNWYTNVIISSDDCDERSYDFRLHGATAGAPTIGNYADTTILTAGGNATIIPLIAPSNATSMTASAPPKFKGQLAVNPSTGVVRVTNAYPAGVYTITVRMLSLSTSFTLTVGNTICGQALFSKGVEMGAGKPFAIAVADFNNDGKQDIIFSNSDSGTVSLRLGDGTGGFTTSGNFVVGNIPKGIVAGDFNGDGNQDFAVVISGYLAIRFGDGTGGFTASSNIPVATTGAIAIGDFNGDGSQDLLVPNTGSNGAVLLGNGLGGFSMLNGSNVAGTAIAVTIGDFNNDGKLDFAGTGNYNTAFIRLGNGNGTFSSATDVPTDVIPISIATGDFNGDGNQDLVVANFARDNVSVRFGNGLGGFSGTTNIPVGNPPVAITTGDFNGDGKLDFFTSTSYPIYNDLRVFLGDGIGGFSGSTVVPTGADPRSLVTADFNGDGYHDLAAANQSGNSVSIFMGGGSQVNLKGNNLIIAAGDNTPAVADNTDFGTVAAATRSFTIQNTGSGSLVIRSINISGVDAALFSIGDIALPDTILRGDSAHFTVHFIPATAGLKSASISVNNNACANSSYSFAIQANSVISFASIGLYQNDTINTAGGAITVAPSFAPLNASGMVAYTSFDFKGILTVNPASGVVTVTNAHPAGDYNITVKSYNGFSSATSSFLLTVHKNTGSTGAFIAAPNITMPGMFLNEPFAVATGDFNGDGKQDITIVKGRTNSAIIAAGDGLGSFVAGADFLVGAAAKAILVGDLNGDGNQDLLTGSSTSGNIVARFGNGAGATTGTANIPVGGNVESVAAGDINNDGIPDFISANLSSNNLSVRLGDGLGNFSGTTNISTGSKPNAVAIADFNNDGNADIAAAISGTNNVSVLLGNGSGGFGAITNFIVGTDPRMVAIGDFNGDHIPDLAIANYGSNTVSIRLGNGSGGFTGTTEISAGVNPIAVTIGDFNGDNKPDLAIANYTAGTVSIRFGDGLGNFTGTADISVGNGPRSIAVGDFNADGRQDIAIANSLSKFLSVLLGSANGIAVEGNNTNIADGDDAPVFIDQTDFGAAVKDSSITHLFTIDKIGPAAGATISDITLEGADSASFTIGGINLPATITTGPSKTFTVTFKAIGTGMKKAFINIKNDACDDTKYQFALQGGVVATALDFDGIDDKVVVNDVNTGNIGTSATTISAWIKTNATTSASIVSKREACAQGSFIDFGITATGRLSVDLNDNSNVNQKLTGAKSVNDGQWHQVTAVRNGVALSLYIDGILDTSATSNSTANINNFAPLTIGSSGCETDGNFFSGQMDELKIWNTALTACDIQNKIQCELVGPQTGLLVYYKFDQGRATDNNEEVFVLVDSSGQAANATLTNFALNGVTSNWIAQGAITPGVACDNTNTWLGFSVDWNLATNWSRGFVPTGCTNVVIYNGVPFMPEITSPDASCFSLKLNNGAILTVKGIGKVNITGKNER